MSTKHVNEADLEYGPNPPGAQYEHTDIDVAVATSSPSGCLWRW